MLMWCTIDNFGWCIQCFCKKMYSTSTSVHCIINTRAHDKKLAFILYSYLNIYIKPLADYHLIQKPWDFHPMVLLWLSQQGKYWELVQTTLCEDSSDYLIQLLRSTFLMILFVSQVSNRGFSVESKIFGSF